MNELSKLNSNVEKSDSEHSGDEPLPISESLTNDENSDLYQSEESFEANKQNLEEMDPDVKGEPGDVSHGDTEYPKTESKRQTINYKQRYESFAEGLKGLQTVEEKLQHAVDFMEATLTVQHVAPHFKSFWDARSIAMELFKENVSPTERLKLWDRYSTLSKESRRLKTLFDEQGAFASEQIEIAIRALEEELQNSDEALAKLPMTEFLKDCAPLLGKKEAYYSAQKKLNLLNAQAGRITALRKELIHTEMRVRQKNKFFQRLSSAGDMVFPLRKEMIKELSQRFTEDVSHFIDQHFSSAHEQESLFKLREDIKSLQGIAKELTLNTQAFTKTRLALSQSWDKLKVLDKERKKVRAEQKEHFKHNAQKVHEQLTQVHEEIKSGQLNDTGALNRLDEIAAELRSVSLGRDEVRNLREALEKLRRPLYEKRESEEQHRISQLHEKERLKKFKFTELKNAIEAFILDLESYDLESVISKKEELIQKIADLTATKSDKQDLEKLLKPVKDAIVDKKESALMALSDTDRQAIQQLREILKQRQDQRSEIKNMLESIRKAKGSSCLDFQQAMSFNSQEAIEKERLEKVSQGIEEIKAKIAMLEGSIK